MKPCLQSGATGKWEGSICKRESLRGRCRPRSPRALSFLNWLIALPLYLLFFHQVWWEGVIFKGLGMKWPFSLSWKGLSPVLQQVRGEEKPCSEATQENNEEGSSREKDEGLGWRATPARTGGSTGPSLTQPRSWPAPHSIQSATTSPANQPHPPFEVLAPSKNHH